MPRMYTAKICQSSLDKITITRTISRNLEIQLYCTIVQPVLYMDVNPGL